MIEGIYIYIYIYWTFSFQLQCIVLPTLKETISEGIQGVNPSNSQNYSGNFIPTEWKDT